VKSAYSSVPGQSVLAWAVGSKMTRVTAAVWSATLVGRRARRRCTRRHRCSTDDQCSRGERGDRCHYAATRTRLVAAYLSGRQRPRDHAGHLVPACLPTEAKRPVDRLKTGWFGWLVRHGELDAAGYGAALAARAYFRSQLSPRTGR